MGWVRLRAYVFSPSFPPVLYAASGRRIHSDCTDTHIICRGCPLISVSRNIRILMMKRKSMLFCDYVYHIDGRT